MWVLGFSTGMVIPCDKPLEVMTLHLLLYPDKYHRVQAFGFYSWLSVQEGVSKARTTVDRLVPYP